MSGENFYSRVRNFASPDGRLIFRLSWNMAVTRSSLSTRFSWLFETMTLDEEPS